VKICDINTTDLFTTVTTSVTDWLMLMQCAYTLMDRYSENKNVKQENIILAINQLNAQNLIL